MPTASARKSGRSTGATVAPVELSFAAGGAAGAPRAIGGTAADEGAARRPAGGASPSTAVAITSHRLHGGPPRPAGGGRYPDPGRDDQKPLTQRGPATAVMDAVELSRSAHDVDHAVLHLLLRVSVSPGSRSRCQPVDSWWVDVCTSAESES